MGVLELIGVVIAAGASIVSAGWALLKVSGNQFEKRLDERFKAQEAARIEGQRAFHEQFTTLHKDQRRLEREFLELRADLPVSYVRREDHIRFETVINAKMDALNSKLDLIAERQKVKE